MGDGGGAGVVIQETVLVTGETAGGPPGPAGETGGVTGPAPGVLALLTAVEAGGTGEAAVAAR